MMYKYTDWVTINTSHAFSFGLNAQQNMPIMSLMAMLNNTPGVTINVKTPFNHFKLFDAFPNLVELMSSAAPTWSMTFP